MFDVFGLYEADAPLMWNGQQEIRLCVHRCEVDTEPFWGGEFGLRVKNSWWWLPTKAPNHLRNVHSFAPSSVSVSVLRPVKLSSFWPKMALEPEKMALPKMKSFADCLAIPNVLFFVRFQRNFIQAMLFKTAYQSRFLFDLRIRMKYVAIGVNQLNLHPES